MALIPRNLSVLAYANGFTLWHYKAPREMQAEIGVRGYFNDAADMLAAGDLIMISAADGARIACILSDDTAVVLAPVG
jgi:hypothetical protein